MQSVSLKVNDLIYKDGTVCFTKVPRTFSLFVCIQQGACACQEDVGKRGAGSDVILHMNSLGKSKNRSLKMKVNLLKLPLWNLRAVVRPGKHTIMVCSEYYVGDTGEKETSWSFLEVDLDPTQVFSFNLRIRSLIAQRGLRPKQKQLKDAGQKKLLIDAKNVIALAAPAVTKQIMPASPVILPPRSSNLN